MEYECNHLNFLQYLRGIQLSVLSFAFFGVVCPVGFATFTDGAFLAPINNNNKMNKISLFKSLPAKGQQHTADEVVTIDGFLLDIKNGKWSNQIDRIRQEPDKKKRSQLKRGLPSVTIGGTFQVRLESELVEHSGFICVDIDDFDDKTALLSDPYTFALFRSASGNGIAVIVKINPDKHKESYRWLSHYYFQNFGISVDPAPKNVASLRYVSFDDELFTNPKSKKSKTKAEPRNKKTKSIPVVYGEDEVGTMVADAVRSGINIAEDYDEYLRLGFALANGFGETGRDYFHGLCSNSSKYNSQQTDRQYTNCLKTANTSGVAVGTFYWMLKNAGVELPQSNKRAVQLVAMAKKSGRTKEGATKQLEELEGMDPIQAGKLADEVFARADIDLSKVASDPDELIKSLIQWLEMNHPMKINSITKKIEEGGGDLVERRLNTIFLRAKMAFNTNEVTKQLVDTIVYSDTILEYNPITDWIDKNRNRNATGNIDKMCKSIKTPTPNAELFIKKWLVSIIAAYDGYAVRSVLALVGGQNTGKTEWFRRLLPAKLKTYYSESKLDAGKDDEMLMTEKLIVMDDEMGGKSKQDEKRFKELTSKAVFSLRAPYARHNEDFKRLAILCGTSNDPQVINDPTGNTRIFPVEVTTIDHDLYNSIDKDELFMELVRLYESGFEWALTKDEIVELMAMSGEFESIPFERELIQEFFEAPAPGKYSEWLTSTQIKNILETETRQKIMSLKKFGIELRNIFGKPVNKRMENGGSSVRAFKVVRTKSSHVTTSETQAGGDIPF